MEGAVFGDTIKVHLIVSQVKSREFHIHRGDRDLEELFIRSFPKP